MGLRDYFSLDVQKSLLEVLEVVFLSADWHIAIKRIDFLSGPDHIVLEEVKG